MIRGWCLLVLLLAAGPAGCAHLPCLGPAGEAPECRTIFLQGRWQVAHAIEAVYPDGSRGLLVGVTVLSSVDRTLDCTLMTVEGFVLLDASEAGAVTIRRAVPPFDRPGFAAGLLADVRLALLAPPGTPRIGRDRQGRPVCRYPGPDGRTTDLLPGAQGWRLEQYDERGRRRRTVALEPVAGGPPGRIRLQAHGPAGYRLDLRLLSAVPAPLETATALPPREKPQ